MRYVADPFPPSQADEAFEGLMVATAGPRPSKLRWTMWHDGFDDAVGFCGVNWSGEDARDGELGLMLRPQCWGRGWCEDGLRALVVECAGARGGGLFCQSYESHVRVRHIVEQKLGLRVSERLPGTEALGPLLRYEFPDPA